MAHASALPGTMVTHVSVANSAKTIALVMDFVTTASANAILLGTETTARFLSDVKVK